MTKRIYNLSPGPAILPEEVLAEAKENILCYGNSGVGILEMSHRSKEFTAIIDEAKANLLKLLGAGDDYEVLFLQGGASLQFYMIPLNLAEGKVPSYILSGHWAKMAIQEAKRLGEVKIVASSEDRNFCYIPEVKDSMIDPSTPYVHFTSNNTIFGTEFKTEPSSNGVPLVCDASSDLLSRKIDIKRYGLIYGGAQKNVGPSGVTIVVIRKDWIQKSNSNLPQMLSFANHSKNQSLFNTPCTFSIYITGLVLKWIIKNGGIEAMQKTNEEKAGILYSFLESSKFYKPTADKDSRSLMNVTFRLPTEELEGICIKEALKAGFNEIKGHRSVGGLRASIYNAFPKQGVVDLVAFLKDFEKKNS